MPISTPVAVALGLGALALVRANSKKKTSNSASSSQHQVLDVVIGPEADPCLGAAYTAQAQQLIPEIYSQVKAPAQALYGSRAVFFMPPAAQGQVFTRLAYYRVNEPFADPMLKVAAELAPNCNWAAPAQAWTPAMTAWHSSIEKMMQVLDADIGDNASLKRPHAWDTVMVLRDKRTLRLKAGSTTDGGMLVSEPVSFELPSGTGDVSLSTTVTPAGGGSLDTLGMHDQGLPDGKGGYALVELIEFLPTLKPTYNGNVVVFRITATRSNGMSTTGTLEIEGESAT